MTMAASEAVLRALSGGLPHTCCSDPCINNWKSLLFFKSRVNCRNNGGSLYQKSKNCSRMLWKYTWINACQGEDVACYVETQRAKRLESMRFKCQRADSVSGVTANENLPPISRPVNTVGVTVNGNVASAATVREKSHKAHEGSVEEEAWDLLRASVVYYCGNPIGTIAANDPSDTSILNYDQVFIRDFIPSGIAFLLKGEYDIVRNFILYTLQLQSWEKTMDCHSPGQGLMPASFKVRTVPLDGDDSATEDILDPDFGEAAIGRVAPVDSGLWWIILLRAYGKCSGDLSVQERVDVQTGIKMILKLCLADGFDMFPMLLVTDGSCMIDRRMGIHGHPLEIQCSYRGFVCLLFS